MQPGNFALQWPVALSKILTPRFGFLSRHYLADLKEEQDKTNKTAQIKSIVSDF